MQKLEHFTSFFKGKKCSGKIKSRRSRNTFKQKKKQLNVANCFEYSLLCFMLNINLTFYNIIKSSVDGDRSQVFWITQKLKPFTTRKNSFFKKSRNQSGKKLLREVKVTIGLERLLSRQLISAFSSCDFFFL